MARGTAAWLVRGTPPRPPPHRTLALCRLPWHVWPRGDPDPAPSAPTPLSHRPHRAPPTPGDCTAQTGGGGGGEEEEDRPRHRARTRHAHLHASAPSDGGALRREGLPRTPTRLHRRQTRQARLLVYPQQAHARRVGHGKAQPTTTAGPHPHTPPASHSYLDERGRAGVAAGPAAARLQAPLSCCRGHGGCGGGRTHTHTHART